MKRSLLLMIMVVFCAVVGQGLVSDRNSAYATDIGGPIALDTTLTFAESPYKVKLSMVVNEGVTLTIEPGVKLEFDSGIGLKVDGQLIARGTQEQQISFTTSIFAAKWGNINFSSNAITGVFNNSGKYAAGSIMEFCIVEKSNGNAISCIEKIPFISNCILKNNDGFGLFVDGLSHSSLFMKLADNTITKNVGGGVGLVGFTSVDIVNNRILENGNLGLKIDDFFEGEVSNNEIIGNGNDGFVVADCCGSDDIIINIFNNTVSANDGDGIVISNTVKGNINNNSIKGNRLIGIEVASSNQDLIINGNTIVGNNDGGIRNSSTIVTILENIITNNISERSVLKLIDGNIVKKNEISFNETSNNDIGVIDVFGNPVVNQNNIHNNKGFALFNNNAIGTNNVDATNNWWGTTDSFAIRTNILDFFTDNTKGQIDIDPIASSPFEISGVEPIDIEPTPEPTPPPGTAIIPVADFSADPRLGAAPLEVVFIDKSTGFPSGWLWEFGDGIISAQKNPTHFYSSPGIYSVSLKVSNSEGENSITKPDLIEVISISTLKADFTADKITGLVPLSVNFKDISIGDPNSWIWEFGDGGVSEDQNPKHDYLAAGIFSPSLTSSRGSESSLEKKVNFINVIDNSPVAEFRASATVGQAPFTVQFTDLSQPVGEIESWIWEFGGGGSSTDQNPEHTYSNEGFFSVALTVSNSFGADVERKTNLIVTKDVNAPVAEFKTSVTAGVAPLPVQFTDLTEPAGSIANWVWQFGDGVISEEQNPSHSYTNEGIYTASLTVSNSAGADSEVKPNIVSVIGSSSKVLAGFTSSSRGGIAPARVEFNNSSAGEVQEFFWDFGDGGSSLEENPLHTYRVAGEYSVTLRVKGASAENSETREKFIQIVDEGGVAADFIATPVIGNGPLDVQFVDKSIGDANVWLWEFGDGSTSEDQNPKHSYFKKNKYSVTLTAQNSKSAESDKVVKQEVVEVLTDGGDDPTPNETPRPGEEPTPVPVGTPSADGSPTANFTADKSEGAAPLTVNFTDLSLNNPTEWLWDFGDGGASFQQNTSHIYGIPGLFSVTLKVENSFGGNSITMPNLINVQQPSTGKSFTFKCRQHSLVAGEHGVFEKMNLELGANEQCTITLTNLKPGTPVEFSTYLRSGRSTSIQVSPANGVTDANGQMDFTISAIEEGSDWIAWAVRNDKGEFEFSKKAYDTGTAWGMFVEVK